MGWPSYATVYRRRHAQPEARTLVARHGREETRRRLTQPIRRDKNSVGALEWVSLDGHTVDVFLTFGDGRTLRFTLLILVDVAPNYVLGWELTESENAPTTVRLIRRVVERCGIFDRLYTDNGSVFAGHLAAGGAVHRFRNACAKLAAVRPLGICHDLGIDLKFALPKNAQAKISERTFATLSRVIDDRPEFQGAPAGHGPGAAPDDSVRPVPIDVVRAVVQREVDRRNREPGRWSQGACGRSYEAVFEAAMAQRIRRQATARQLYLAGLIYTPAAVDRWGRVTLDGWTYGGPETQEALRRHHGAGRRVLVGRDLADFSAPALAFDEGGRLICEGIEPVKAGAYGSADGIRDAARNRKAARDAVAAANDYLSEAAYAAAVADLPGPAPSAPAARRIVAGRFAAPLRPAAAEAPEAEPDAVTAEMQENMNSGHRRTSRGEEPEGRCNAPQAGERGRGPPSQTEEDMAEIVRLAKPEAPPRPRPGGFLMTTTAEEIRGSLNLIRSSSGGGMTVIAGAPGIGKTEALLHLAQELKDGALYLRVAKGEGRPWSLAYSIMRGWGAAPHEDRAFLSGGLRRARERLAESIGPDCIVLEWKPTSLDRIRRR